MARRWYNRPHNLQRIYLAQLGVTGFGALEGTRRILNGDYQFYSGYAGSKPRLNSHWDSFWSTVFGEDDFVTPEKLPAKVGQKRDRDSKARKGLQISPDDKSLHMRRRSDGPTGSNKRFRGSASGLAMALRNTTGENKPGREEDPVIPFGPPANVLAPYHTFKGRNVVYTEFDMGSILETTGAVSASSKYTKAMRIRLNSPNDVNPIVSGTDQFNKSMNGWDLWKSYYQYWKLISTNVKITFIRRSQEVRAVSGTQAFFRTKDADSRP